MRLVPLTLLALACAPDDVPTRAEGHRGGAGYWPQNSPTAAEGAFREGLDVELDVVLTRDRVPLFSQNVFLDPGRCLDGGASIVEVERWDEVDSRRLPDIACGGWPEPDFPNAVVVGESPLTLDRLTKLLRDAPDDVRIHLDIQHEPGLTPGAAVFAREVLDRWIEADLPQDLLVSARLPETLRAFEDHGRERGVDVTTILEWPSVDPSDTWSSLVAEDLGHRITNTDDYVTLARDAGADGISVQHELADRRALEVARREGLLTMVWTVDGEAALRPWLGRVDVVVTNYPGDLGEAP